MSEEAKLHEYRPAPHLRQLVFDDPATRNALTIPTRARFVAALKSAAEDRDCRVVIVTAVGKTFVSGSDVRMLAASTAEDVIRREVRDLWDALYAFPKPIVVALNGHALGGGLELALCGDIIIAARGIKIGTPEPKLGIIPGGGATQRLVRAVGTYRAKRLLLSAEPIDAETAERWGIVCEICEPDNLQARAQALAEGIAALPPQSMVAIKQALRDGADLPLTEGLAIEVKAFQRVFRTADKAEGMAAFLEKRPARFTGE